MEHMDLDQPTIQNEEQKKSKLHARDGEDDTSYPSGKCGKLIVDLPDEKPAIKEDHRWTYMFDFKHGTSETPQVYQDLIDVCEKEIQDCEKAFKETSIFFETNFGKLKEKQPCLDSTCVIETFRYMQEATKRSIETANKILPSFKKDVENYINYRNGPLSAHKLAKTQYGKKLEQLVEIPNVEKVIKWLFYVVKDSKEIEHFSGLAKRDLNRTIFFLGTKKNIYIKKEPTMEKEQFSESEMNDMLNQHKAAMKEVSSARIAHETVEAIVKNHIHEHELAVTRRVRNLGGALESADDRLRIMRRQLELLLQKDVMNNGYDESFDDDWEKVCRPDRIGCN